MCVCWGQGRWGGWDVEKEVVGRMTTKLMNKLGAVGWACTDIASFIFL